MRFPTPFRSVVLLVALVACANSPNAQPHSGECGGDIAELWKHPVDLVEVIFFQRPRWPRTGAAAERADYEFVAFKTTGTNPGYDVKDASGRPVERLPWHRSAIGSHGVTDPVGDGIPAACHLLHVEQYTLTGADAGVKTQARFRTDLPEWRPTGEWSWQENPFVDSTEPRADRCPAVLNNWDLKSSNNRLYDATDPAATPRRQFMVRDVGSSLGHSRQFRLFAMLGTRGAQGSKNDVDDFEQQGFIEKVEGNKVRFDYRGMNQPLVDTRDRVGRDLGMRTARADSRRTLASGVQGRLASAGAYRSLHPKIKEKIAQGLALKATVTR